MIRCPKCTHASYSRTSRYIKRTKEAYYQCQNLSCSCTFKTVERVNKILSQPRQTQTAIKSSQPQLEKQTLNRYSHHHTQH
ncbi:TPA: ogr/Delta-like zinc finger family protein [Serratia rubidaea]|nr:ogr/Delta-like zinc finger family protein [Serratia rubidaea]HDJ1447727.1 ogr/Delta-like zinc finger family protein [Serratia rubidaea]HDJ1462734.1 ogr/Delta-like zinc finger family protein [Serratia rubidaea]HDJ2774766.1 ogr/Delta-like zinc finger family protein [Serratia rubidaea]